MGVDPIEVPRPLTYQQPTVSNASATGNKNSGEWLSEWVFDGPWGQPRLREYPAIVSSVCGRIHVCWMMLKRIRAWNQISLPLMSSWQELQYSNTITNWSWFRLHYGWYGFADSLLDFHYLSNGTSQSRWAPGLLSRSLLPTRPKVVTTALTRYIQIAAYHNSTVNC